MSEVTRENDGRWSKGSSGNPKGLSGRVKISQFLWNRYEEELADWMPKFFDSIEQLYLKGEYEKCAKLYLEAMKTVAGKVSLDRSKTQIPISDFRGLKIGNSD